jgi:hypothetical protein
MTDDFNHLNFWIDKPSFQLGFGAGLVIGVGSILFILWLFGGG